jgi:thioredoxin-dependent peroxiredoxin
MASLTIGAPAPTLQLLDSNNQTVTIPDQAHSWTILYFYPKDNTPGCTTEAIDFTNLLPEFQQLGARVVGVSPDSVTSHGKFITKHSLTIQLLSDPDHIAAEAYGVWQLKKFMGKEYMGIVRSTFAIDPQGHLAQAWPKVSVKNHGVNVLKWLQAAVG